MTLVFDYIVDNAYNLKNNCFIFCDKVQQKCTMYCLLFLFSVEPVVDI